MTPIDPTAPPLAARLRALRRAANMKQAALAKRAQLSQSMLSRLERGSRGRRPSPAVVRRLADALGVAPEDLALQTKI